MFDLIVSGRDDFRGMRPPGFGGDRAGIDTSHLEDVLEQPGQPFDLRQNEIALAAPLIGCEPGGHDIARRDPDGRQRRPQVVPDGCEKRRLQAFALASQLPSLPLLQKLRALDRDRHDPGEGIERACLDRTAAAARIPVGLVPTRSGTRRISCPSTVIVR